MFTLVYGEPYRMTGSPVDVDVVVPVPVVPVPVVVDVLALVLVEVPEFLGALEFELQAMASPKATRTEERMKSPSVTAGYNINSLPQLLSSYKRD